MKELAIGNVVIFLDGEEVKKVKEYYLVSSAKKLEIAELTPVMDVVMSQVVPESFV